jgi:peroxiredoxin
MNRSAFYWLGGVLIGLAVGVVILFGLPETPVQDPVVTQAALEETPDASPEVGLAVGNLAPDFTLLDLEGNPVSLSDYRGQVVLLNFWATWCAPCRVEMPTFQSYFELYQSQDFVVLGVDFDEPEDRVRQFGQELGIGFPLLLDPGGEVQALYNIRGYPSSVFIRPDGTIGVIHIGIMVESQLENYLTQLGLDV